MMKRVTFQEDLISGAGDCQCLPELSESQCQSLWYSDRELRNFRTEARIIRRNPEAMNPRTDTFRGLDLHTKRTVQVRMGRKEHVRLVKELQLEQYFNKAHDPEAIRLVAMQHSERSVQRAILEATRDFVEAFKVYRETPGLKAKFRKQVDVDNYHSRSGLIARPPSRVSVAATTAAISA